MRRAPMIPFAALSLVVLASARTAPAQVCSPLPRTLAPEYAQSDDQMGFEVAASGPWVAIGRPGSDGGKGTVVTVQRSGDAWESRGFHQPTNAPAGCAFGYSVAMDFAFMVVGAPYDNPAGVQSGSAYLYFVSEFDVNLVAKVPGEDAFSLFGLDVAVSTPAFAVSDLSASGESVRVFRWTGVAEEEAVLVPPGGGAGSLFGLSIAMSGDRIAVGAPGEDTAAGADSGAVYVFERGSGDWSAVQQVLPTTQHSGARFGSSVALEGNRLVVGAPRADDPTTDAGRVSVFRRAGGSWIEEATLLAPDTWTLGQTGSGDLFGWSVAIDWDAIAVGAPGKDDVGTDTGAAYVYVLDGGVWTCQHKSVGPGSVLDAEFGAAVAVSGEDAFAGRPAGSAGTSGGAAFAIPCFRSSAKFPRPSPLDQGGFGFSVSAWRETVLVGAPNSGLGAEEEGMGSASVWVPRGTSWTKEADLVPFDATPNARLGRDLALDGDLAAVGSPGARVAGVTRGAVYVFARDGGGTWAEERKISPAGVVAADSFGNDLALDGDTLAGGAKLDDDFGTNSGSVYVFARSGGAWDLEQQLFPDETVPFAHFGASIAVSEDTLVVGAPHDELGQLGFGAAYVFTRSGGVWTLEATLTHETPFVGDRFGTGVDVSGDTIAVVAPGQGGILKTFVYSRSGGWVLDQTLEQDVLSVGNGIHAGLSLEGDLLAVATDAETASPGLGRGFVTLYVRSDGVWQARQVLASNEGSPGDAFGSAVSISGGGNRALVAIGDMTKFGRVPNEGAVYAYRLDVFPPFIACSDDVIVREDASGGALAYFFVEAEDDVDPDPTIECSHTSGSFFPTGATTVTCRATDDLNNESTCTFDVHVLPDEIYFRRGNVEGRSFPERVLLVNGSAGDPIERRLFLSAADPLVMRVKLPPEAEGLTADLVMYVWLRAPSAATVRELPFNIGFTCLPTPLNPGAPQPKLVANSIGYAGILGVENWPGPATRPAPTVLLSLPSVGRSITFFAQGLVVERRSQNGELAVTNGVLVEVSD